jgi:hypothetical protein
LQLLQPQGLLATCDKTTSTPAAWALTLLPSLLPSPLPSLLQSLLRLRLLP